MKHILFFTLLFCLVAAGVVAQSRHIKGIVLDADNGRQLDSVRIRVGKPYETAVYSNAVGMFLLPNVEGRVRLTFYKDGYFFLAEKLAVKDSVCVVRLKKNPDDGMVNISFQQKEKRALTESVGVVRFSAETAMGIVDIRQYLMTIPGVQFAGDEIRIRGTGSIHASNAALIVVDGIAYYGDLRAIDPSDIAKIEVLKDISSTALYGQRGVNGVVVITTKSYK